MIDGTTYRLAQSLARRQIPNWHIAQFHEVVFDHLSFPSSITSFSELAQLLDTMQENRFEHYMREQNGLTDAEFTKLINVFVDHIDFQRTFMPDVVARLPYSTLMSHFQIYRKLHDINPNFSSLLEIGPGCGYLPFFLRNHHGLRNYSQIEACEAYYLLQSTVDSWIFRGRFDERAYPQGQGDAQHYFTLNNSMVEKPDYVEVPFEPVCTHYPWWRLGELIESGQQFEIITSNANLKEFSSEALQDYLYLIKQLLREDGVVFCQCLGGPVVTGDEDLRKTLFENEFAPLVYVEGAGPIAMTVPGEKKERRADFPVGQGIFVKRGHPLFDTYYDAENFTNHFMANDPNIIEVFFPNGAARSIYGRDEIKERVLARLPSCHTTVPASPTQDRLKAVG